ncbi:PREDICTED: zygote arrest protein 1 [Gekko japonicus]|uniref:Zygote arrest protein 1 n=1 Tax=Gekko japonicus TaxID=146911 RepID=A0ABM1K3R7_GEKJA|nr:PREDICTED: zygote arrest protein 1 [Gekko japonicus]
MATSVEEAMESYVYPSYNPYSYRYPTPKGKGPAPWRQRGGYFSSYGESAAAAAAAAAEYFDNYQRAQLKAILSQVNPSLTPRLRKANTKEMGVQVNPRQDASVQCSLGPRPLLLRRRAPPEQGQGSPVSNVAARAVRFPRTIAVYSPVAHRRATAKEQEEPGQSKTRVRFQFLEQKYGYYHCKDCNIRWESAYVWCVQGTNKVYFRQFCRTCQKSYNPYRVEDITCQSCKQKRCTCPVKLRHVDPKKPHRQDLCGRCKGKRLSCDSTFSFKYII